MTPLLHENITLLLIGWALILLAFCCFGLFEYIDRRYREHFNHRRPVYRERLNDYATRQDKGLL